MQLSPTFPWSFFYSSQAHHLKEFSFSHDNNSLVSLPPRHHHHNQWQITGKSNTPPKRTVPFTRLNYILRIKIHIHLKEHHLTSSSSPQREGEEEWATNSHSYYYYCNNRHHRRRTTSITRTADIIFSLFLLLSIPPNYRLPHSLTSKSHSTPLSYH